MKESLTILFIFLTFTVLSQTEEDYWENWNSNYPPVNIEEVLKNEKLYADSVEKNPEIPQYYGRYDQFRFHGEYLGNVRPLSKSIRSSMKMIYKIFVGDPAIIDKVIESEVLIKIGNEEIWMSIQKQLIEAFNEELKSGDKVLLYCLFLNEHSEKNGLRNMFIISEFIK